MACCIWNTCIPKSSPDKVIVQPEGCCTWFTGLACSYDQYSYKAHAKHFGGTLTERDFEKTVDEINDGIGGYLPCPTMWCCAYLLAIPTLCLSLLLVSKCCVADATASARRNCDKMNSTLLNNKGWHVSLRIQKFTSWI